MRERAAELVLRPVTNLGQQQALVAATGLSKRGGQTLRGQQPGEHAVGDHLAVDQNAVAVEYDQLQISHARDHRSPADDRLVCAIRADPRKSVWQSYQTSMAQPTFYFDIGSPFAYLAAERLSDVLAGPVRWQPVSLGALFELSDRSSWAVGDPQRRQEGIAEVERRAGLYGLPPVRWPDPWPGNYLMAMRAATFAYRAGRGREFAMGALRSAFQEGVDLSIAEHVLQVAQSTGLESGEVEQATQDPEIKLALREATDAANSAGVFGVPTIAVNSELFWGDDRLEDAALHRRRTASE